MAWHGKSQKLLLQLLVSIDLGVKYSWYLKCVLFKKRIDEWCKRPASIVSIASIASITSIASVAGIACVLLVSLWLTPGQIGKHKTHTLTQLTKHSQNTVWTQLFVSAEMYMFTYIWGQLWRVVPINRFFVCWPVVANVRDALFVTGWKERERERGRTEEGKT